MQQYLAEAAKLRPQDPEVHRSLAEIYDATGRLAEAAEERRLLEQLSKFDGAKPN